MNAVARSFEIKPAVREAVGLLISLVGPSSSGKTYTALRLASGIKRIMGGEIDFIDTENRRALYYADKFQFNHLNFTAPFSPLDYLEAIRYTVKRGAKTIIVDSGSHEHEGPGGVLEWHEQETKRLAKLWGVSEAKAQMAAWAVPKAARRRLINEVLQMNVNLIFTFRAKEKIKIVSGKDPIPLGWQPICGEEFMYEFVLQCLLPPGSEGRPRWNSEMESERAIMKLPTQFKGIFRENQQLDESIGERLAEWAVGGIKLTPEAESLIADYARCEDEKTLKSLESRRASLWGKMPAPSKQRVKSAADAALERIAKPAMSESSGPQSPEVWITTMNGCETSEQLEKTWEGCKRDLGDGMPDEVHFAYTTAKEKLGERK